MSVKDPTSANEETREVWNYNAQFWDENMGEGNDFVEVLCWPAIERMLDLRPDEQILDIACGNGLTSRRLDRLGGQVTAIDFAEEMLAAARKYESKESGRIDYRAVDATDEDALLALGEGQFDGAISNMALFDMAQIGPLYRALARLLKPGGRFVFSVCHPCFNSTGMAHYSELWDDEGTMVQQFGVKVFRYMTSVAQHGLALRDQPRPHLYFDRPLHELLGPGLEVGLVIDGLEERTFPADHPPGSRELTWGANFSEIPPVLVVRMRKVAG